MTYCQWCGQPAVQRIEIEPSQQRMVTKLSQETGEKVTAPETVRFAIYADVCEHHGAVRDREGGKPIRDARRVDVVQLDIFGGESRPRAPRGPRNAIGGLP